MGLGNPIISERAKKYLTAEEFKNEFNHTILHK